MRWYIIWNILVPFHVSRNDRVCHSLVNHSSRQIRWQRKHSKVTNPVSVHVFIPTLWRECQAEPVEEALWSAVKGNIMNVSVSWTEWMFLCVAAAEWAVYCELSGGSEVVHIYVSWSVSDGGLIISLWQCCTAGAEASHIYFCSRHLAAVPHLHRCWGGKAISTIKISPQV